MSEKARRRLLYAMLPGMAVIVGYNLWSLFSAAWFWFSVLPFLEQALIAFYVVWALFLITAVWRVIR